MLSRSLIFLVIALGQSQAQTVFHSLLPAPRGLRLSDHLLVHWNPDAIEAFDRDGRRVLGINVPKLLPSAKKISIDDIAVRRDRLLAVAAVTREKDDRTQAWLLYVGWDGELVRAVELDASKEIGWLEFDEAGDLWALTDYLGRKVQKDTIEAGIPCPLGPLIQVYDAEGKVVKSLLKQADFPEGLQESPTKGQVTFGLTGDKVWFWQPFRHRMIITDRYGRRVQKISIPLAPTWNMGGSSLLLPSGEVLADVWSPTPSVRGMYLARAQSFKKWAQPDDARLIGMDGSELVFVSKSSTGPSDFLIARRPLSPL
ncbi:exported hypothetical protein [Candidatus Sulfopaludibacter sp. SbA3]|nr:exported hypothetical protein [Candidatus Sulfopaludibacter sp. SbA3]